MKGLGFKRSIVLFLGLFICSGCAGISSHTLELLDTPAPASRLVLDDGTYSTTEAYKGEDLVLLFWTSICHHSENVVQDFDDFASDFKKNTRVTFMAVNVDKFENLESVKTFIQEEGLTHIKHAYSGNDLYDEAFLNFRGDLVPFFVVINKQGVIKVMTASLGDVEDYLEG